MTATSSDSLTASELTQRTMVSDLMENKPLLIGLGISAVLLFLMLSRRPAPQAQAARRLVRDWRNVDDLGDARDLIGTNVPAIMRPALLIVLAEIERQVDQGFRRLERAIHRL